MMNVIRRILEYYFLQLCGYDGATLRKRILMDNKDKFITHKEDGSEDTTQYQMASAANVNHRIHSALGYLTPAEYYQQSILQNVA
jgi:transposase InsO family protein